MKNPILTGIFVTSIALFSAPNLLAQCRASDDQTALVLEYVKGVASMNVPARDSLGLAGVDTSQVVAVIDTITCTRVAQVVDSVFEKTTPTVYIVVRAGGRYVARHPDVPGSEPNQLLHFVDTTYVYRRTTIF